MGVDRVEAVVTVMVNLSLDPNPESLAYPSNYIVRNCC